MIDTKLPASVETLPVAPSALLSELGNAASYLESLALKPAECWYDTVPTPEGQALFDALDRLHALIEQARAGGFKTVDS